MIPLLAKSNLVSLSLKGLDLISTVRSKITFTDQGVYQIFYFKRTCICQTLDSYRYLHVLVLTLHRFFMHKSFQLYCVKNPQIHVLVYVPGFESVLYEKICGNFTWFKNLQFTHTIAFQSALHDNSNTWQMQVLWKWNTW